MDETVYSVMRAKYDLYYALHTYLSMYVSLNHVNGILIHLKVS